MITKPVVVFLNTMWNRGDTSLPLSEADRVRLAAVVPDGESIYLTVKDNLNQEYILVTNTGGYFLAERGVDSDQFTFPKGACVFFENSLPVTRWEICNYDCCETECPCVPVNAEAFTLLPATVGQQWEGTAIFSGDLGDMHIAFTSTPPLPSWVDIQVEANSITFSGTPTATGTYTITAVGTNCSGRNLSAVSSQLVVG